MNLLLASSEIHPYSKSGGLGDMVGAMARAMASEGQQVAVVTPLYRGIRERFSELKKSDWPMRQLLGSQVVEASVWMLEANPKLTFYFIDQPEFYDRAGLYQENGADYPDNAERFIFFSKCVTQLARDLPAKPDVVHVHDWQAGLVPLFIYHLRERAGWGNAPRSCLTIHNLAYQGMFSRAHYDLTNLPLDYFHPDGAEFYGGLNCLKAGITFADAITTVSPRYAREITTEAFGCGLDGVLRRRQHLLSGILNGVDYGEWDPANDTLLPQAYSLENLEGKRACKLALQRELGLPEDADIPLFSNITRLVEQKGVDIQLGALEEMLAAEMQFVLLGSGSPVFARAYQNLAERFPTKVVVRVGFDHTLSHRIEAASDFYLMPSLFEPCGLNQMYSLRYGTIPIVRLTGGLDDSVIDIAEDEDRANGIKFNEHSVAALSKEIRKALVLFAHSDLMQHFRKNAMTADFSWKRTTAEYLKVYETALQLRPAK